MKFSIVFISLALMSGVGVCQAWPFRDYPEPVFHGTPVIPKLDTPLSRDHRTIIRASVREGPNFAGHFTVVLWGCGTECGVFVIVDDRTGKVYEPPELARGVSLAVGGPEFRTDSALLVLADCPDPRVYGLENCQRRFYRWNGTRLDLIRSDQVTAQ